MSEEIHVFTDGACTNNGKANARAGIGIYFGKNDPRNVSKELYKGKKSNNVAELTALICVGTILGEEITAGVVVNVYTDSEYARRCCGEYGAKCEKKGWVKKKKNGELIPNAELVKYAYELYKGCGNVRFQHVDAHTGGTSFEALGNAAADELAGKCIGVVGEDHFGRVVNRVVDEDGNRLKVSSGRSKVIFLKVPYDEKEGAKKMGARWNPDKKKWWIYADNKHVEIMRLRWGI